MTGEQKEQWRIMLAGNEVLRAAIEEADSHSTLHNHPPADMTSTLAAWFLGYQQGYADYPLALHQAGFSQLPSKPLESNYGWREKLEKQKHG